MSSLTINKIIKDIEVKNLKTYTTNLIKLSNLYLNLL